jgi:hypothetical protein
MDWNEIPHDPCHVGVPSSSSKTISKPTVCSVQTVRLSWGNISTLRTDQNGIPHDLHHLGVPSGGSKTISEPMVRLAQTVLLSCSDTNSVSKWTKTRFHRTDITEKLRQVRPKWFLSLWYFRHKPCTYLASRLALSPNGPKRDSTRSTSPRSTIGCMQNDFRAYVTFSANRAPILLWH